MRKLAQSFIRDESAATAVEYGLIAGLIAVVVIVGMTSAFNAIGAKFNVVSNTISGS